MIILAKKTDEFSTFSADNNSKKFIILWIVVSL